MKDNLVFTEYNTTTQGSCLPCKRELHKSKKDWKPFDQQSHMRIHRLRQNYTSIKLNLQTSNRDYARTSKTNDSGFLVV